MTAMSLEFLFYGSGVAGNLNLEIAESNLRVMRDCSKFYWLVALQNTDILEIRCKVRVKFEFRFSKNRKFIS